MSSNGPRAPSDGRPQHQDTQAAASSSTEPSGNNARSISISIPPAVARPRKTSFDGGNASLVSSIANLCNTIIGTGMVALPGAFVYTGWLLGVFLIILCGCTGALGLYLLTRCANKLGGRRQSFFSVALKTIPKGARWFDLAIALKCYGVSISYLIISGQLMPQVVLSFLKAAGHEHEAIPPLLLDRDFWVTLLVVLLMPLCFLRKLDSLRHTSYLSLTAVAYLVVIVVVFAASPTARSTLPERGEVHALVFSPHILAIFPVFVFAFTCAQNMLPVYNELSASDPLMHLDRAKSAIGSAIGGAGSVYVAVGVLGYLEFGSNLGDNIIAMYPSSSVFVAVGRLSIVLLTIFSYPLQVHPCRAALDKVISPPSQRPGIELPAGDDERRNTRSDEDEDEDDEDDARGYETLLASQTSLISSAGGSPPDEISLQRWVSLTAFLLATTFSVALLVDDLSIILGFVGGMGSTTISFILPGILYSSLHDDGDRFKRPAKVLACWGLFVGVVSVTSNVVKLTHSAVNNGGDGKADRLAALVGRSAEVWKLAAEARRAQK